MLDYATIGSNYSLCMMRWGSLKKHIVAHVWADISWILRDRTGRH